MWWMIFMILIVAVPLIGLGLYETWRNNQIDKYNEEQRQKTVQGTTVAA